MTTDDTLVLPIGMTEFNEMMDKVIAMSGMPNNDSVRFAIATAVLHFPQEKPELTYSYFARVLRRAAANQVASQIFQDIKLKQQAEIEQQQQLAKQAEATTPVTEGVPSESQKN